MASRPTFVHIHAVKTPPFRPVFFGRARLFPAVALVLWAVVASPVSYGEPAKQGTSPLLDLVKKKMPPKDVTPDEAERVMQLQPDLVILDVRTAEEFASGHIRGAVNVDFFDREFSEKLKKYEGKPVLIHCASGGRSGQTVEKIKDGPFAAIFHLKGGFTGWQAAGKPTAK